RRHQVLDHADLRRAVRDHRAEIGLGDCVISRRNVDAEIGTPEHDARPCRRGRERHLHDGTRVKCGPACDDFAGDCPAGHGQHLNPAFKKCVGNDAMGAGPVRCVLLETAAVAGLMALATAALFWPWMIHLSTALIGPPEDNLQDFWNSWYA